MITFTNQAALSYRNRVRYSNLTTGQIADALTMTKEALTATYGPGGRNYLRGDPHQQRHRGPDGADAH